MGFDDAPFPPGHRGDVRIIGAAYAGVRLEGVLSGKVRRDGINATRTLIDLVTASRFASHTRLIMLQGIAFAGFNVVDLNGLYEAAGMPVLVVMRRMPDFAAIRRALMERVPGGRRKWALIQQAGAPESADGLYVQRAGLTLAEAEKTIRRLAIHSTVPEPLRSAHIIAGGWAGGSSRQRV